MLKPSTNDPNYKEMMRVYNKNPYGWGVVGLPKIKKVFESGVIKQEPKVDVNKLREEIKKEVKLELREEIKEEVKLELQEELEKETS